MEKNKIKKQKIKCWKNFNKDSVEEVWCGDGGNEKIFKITD